MAFIYKIDAIFNVKGLYVKQAKITSEKIYNFVIFFHKKVDKKNDMLYNQFVRREEYEKC